MPLNETRQIHALDDDELEELIKKWIARLISVSSEYVDFDRPTASADEGRDSVGFLTDHRYDGAWDNYQCKHLKKPLGFGTFMVELGKMFYYAERGDFILPRKYVFVVPNSAVREVQKLIDRPSKIGPALLENWDTHCATGITTAGAPLTDDIREAIGGYNFDTVMLWKSSHIVEQDQMRGVLVEVLDIDPGEAPTLSVADVPTSPGIEETGYLGQLLRVYGDHRGKAFADHDEIMNDVTYAPRVTRARRQYLERKAFRLHFRDNLDNNLIDQVDTDVLDSVHDLYDRLEEASSYDRLLRVIEGAAGVEVSGPLGKHRRVTPRVKQGVCHHHASEGAMPLKWDR